MPVALQIHVWSDVACPWCYVGKKRLEQAAGQLGSELEIEWHSFELDPSPLNRGDTRDNAQRLADKYGRSRKQAEDMVAQMTQTGVGCGIAFDFAHLVRTNTFSLHRLLHWAKGHSLEAQNALKQSFLDAHFTQGKDLNDRDTLLQLVEAVGLDVEAASGVLETDEFSSEVHEDQAMARELGVTGVPFFVIGQMGVAGAQSVEVFKDVLEKASALEPETVFEEGSVCTPEGC